MHLGNFTAVQRDPEETYLDRAGSAGLNPSYRCPQRELVASDNAAASCALLNLASRAREHQNLQYAHPKTRRRLSVEAVEALERVFGLNRKPGTQTISILAKRFGEDESVLAKHGDV